MCTSVRECVCVTPHPLPVNNSNNLVVTHLNNGTLVHSEQGFIILWCNQANSTQNNVRSSHGINIFTLTRTERSPNLIVKRSRLPVKTRGSKVQSMATYLDTMRPIASRQRHTWRGSLCRTRERGVRERGERQREEERERERRRASETLPTGDRNSASSAVRAEGD